MNETYLTIKESGNHELDIKKSRFIGNIKRVETESDAQQFIDDIRKENRKANHNCFAYQIGAQNDIQRASDDGEPVGTAGVPMLEVLKQINLQNTVIVATRYFGGIKLGTGGLIRAYSHTTTETIRKIGIVRCSQQRDINCLISYTNLGAVSNFFAQAPETITNITYAENVVVQLSLDLPEVESTQQALTNLLNGNITFKLGDTHYAEHQIDY